MQKNRLIKYISAALSLVFIVALSIETMHFMVIPHYQNHLSISENGNYSQIPFDFHSCEFKFTKTPFKFDIELNIKELIITFFEKKTSFNKNELAQNSIKYSFNLRGPPIVSL